MILSGWKRRLEHIILIGLALMAVKTINAAPSLTLRLGDVAVSSADQTVPLTISIINPLDHIAGFELMLLQDRPDLIAFTSSIDPSEALVAGWEYLGADALENGRQLHLVGLAEMLPPITHLPIFPSDVERPMLRTTVHIRPIADTVSERTVPITIDTSLQNFGLANDQGELIGLRQDTMIDTTYYRCLQSDDTGCVLWQIVVSPPYDRIKIDTTFHAYHDTGYFSLIPGSITILPNCTPIIVPGDVNRDGVVSNDDLFAMEAFVSTGAPSLASAHNADLNGDSCVGTADIALLQKYLEFGPDSVTVAGCAIQYPPRCCCVGKRGNVSGDVREVVDLSDLSYLVHYLTTGGTLPCPKEADWNGSGVIDLSDLSALVAYLIGVGTAARDCP